MRILMGVHGLPPASTGGTEIAALRLARALAVDHAVTLFHPTSARELRPGIETVRHDSGVRIITRVFAPPSRFEQTWRRDDVDAWFGALLDRYRPDLVHLHHLTGLSMRLPELARQRKIPTVMTLHDYWLPCARGQRMNLELEVCPGPRADRCAVCLADQIALERPVGRVLQPLLARLRPPAGWLERATRWREQTRSGPDDADEAHAGLRIRQAFRALDAATLLAAPSRHLIDAYRELGVDPARLRFVDHGFRSRAVQPPPPLPASPLHIGFIGAKIPTKAPHLLLSALESLGSRPLRVTLIGPTPAFHRQPGYGARLEAQAHRLGAAQVGAVPPEAVPGWLEGFHVLVVPSIWPENAPLVIGEAFQQGVPVIASSIGGIPERIVDHTNGRLFRPGDVEGLAAILASIADEPDTLEALRNGAWRTPLPSMEAHVACYQTLYQEAMASDPPPVKWR